MGEWHHTALGHCTSDYEAFQGRGDGKRLFMSEYLIHTTIVQHLRAERLHKGKLYPHYKYPFDGVTVLHIYQGRSKEEGFFLKRLGVLAGAADLLAFWEGGWGFLEVKTTEGRLSEGQKRFKQSCEMARVNYALVRSVTEAHQAIKRWGAKELDPRIEEPELRDKDAARRAFHHEMLKRPSPKNPN